MYNVNSLQLSAVVPAGNHSMTIANVGGMWPRNLRPFIDLVSPPRSTAVEDFVCLNERTYTISSGIETKQYYSQIGLWAHDWKAFANYNWLFAGQNTTVASFWRIDATVWRPTSADEIVYWFCIGGLAVRTAIEMKKSSGTVVWLLPAATSTTAESPTIPSHSTHEQGLAQWIGKLESLSRLAPGWNRQGAVAPSQGAIRAAQQFIEAMVDNGQPPTRVAASAVGGVGVTRQVGQRMAYIEFYNDGGACALFADDGEDDRVLDVASEGGTFRNLLDEVKAYLNG